LPPFWRNGADMWAPAADSVLVSFTVSPNRVAKVYGWFILCSEANQFYLRIGTDFYRIAVFTAGGEKCIVSKEPIFDNIPAGTEVAIHNVNAGTAGNVYRASILIDQIA